MQVGEWVWGEAQCFFGVLMLLFSLQKSFSFGGIA